MLDTNDLLISIKKAAKEAVDAGQPSDFCFGRVTSQKPLKISVEQKMILTSAQLVLTRNVTDYSVEMTVNHTTDNSLDVNMQHSHVLNGQIEAFSGSTDIGGNDDPHMHSYSHSHSFTGIAENSNSVNLSHSHGYTGRKAFTVHNGLKVGEEVVLMKQKGGQKYLVLDRVVNI